MGYKGVIKTIPLGMQGLSGDDPQTTISPSALIRSINIRCDGTSIQTELGSRKWNTVALPSSIMGFVDFWPDAFTQRLIVVCENGKVYKFTDQNNFVEVTGSGTNIRTTLKANNQVYLLTCGSESAGRKRKVFIFTGRDPVQVISGDAIIRTNISTPAADWSTVTGTDENHPFFGIIHKNSIWALGNGNDPHRVYKSTVTDHENFTGTLSGSYSIYPGESERLISAFIYKKKLFFMKNPVGIYQLDDDNADIATWSIQKLLDSFGGVTRHCSAQALDDVVIANAYGGITGIQAVQEFGDVRARDTFATLRCEKSIRRETSQQGDPERHIMFYPDRKLVYVTYRGPTSTQNDKMVVMDLSDKTAKVTISDKDQANCLAMFKDQFGVIRPMYGSSNGFLYQLDWPDQVVGDDGYISEFQTPHMDFGDGNQDIADQIKNFENLEFVIEATGDWPIKVDVYYDSVLSHTSELSLAGGSELGLMKLDVAKLYGDVPLSVIVPLHGSGRRVSFRCYTRGNGEHFKILSMRVYYQLSGQQQRRPT